MIHFISLLVSASLDGYFIGYLDQGFQGTPSIIIYESIDGNVFETTLAPDSMLYLERGDQ